MATAKERAEFIGRIVQEFPNNPDAANIARLMLRHAKTHERLMGDYCNVGASPELERREKQVERRLRELAAELGAPIKFSGDPRGYTVKLTLPSGRYNSFGGREEGYGVPQ